MTMLLAATFLTPLLLALLLTVGRLRTSLAPLVPWTALPALLAALLLPDGSQMQWPNVLFGMQLAVDPVARIFLLFSALLWIGAGHFARGWLRDDPWASTFHLCWLLAMAGNLGLLIAADVLSFYLFFALMTFSAWGLVIHRRSHAALHAGMVYIVLAVFGEGLLLAGMLLAVGAAGGVIELAAIPAAVANSPWRDLISALLLAGFGIKAGLLPLHVWLPLAHPAAPIPASAVLSGAMIKAGLLGWLRFLPFGEVALPGLGITLLGLGLSGVFFGVLYGLMQHNIKALLAYSSVSQMGLIASACGLTLWQPALLPGLVPAITLYALHHALTKGALFLSVGMAMRLGPTPLVLAAGALAALSLAGAPYSGGALAKATLKNGLGDSADWLALSWSVGAAGTTLLMVRFMQLLHRRPASATGSAGGQSGGWILVLVAGLTGPWLITLTLPTARFLPAAWDALWPMLAGAIVALAVRGRALPQWPAGDLAVWADKRLHRLRHHWRSHLPTPPSSGPAWRRLGQTLTRWHRRATTNDIAGPLAGAALILLAAMLFLAVG
jgi:formate hydrogenlyase subunit 3/multisubunit Na+/H+ antiporter MnhD subunit